MPAVLFGLWFLAFMLLESLVNSRGADVLGVDAVNAVYSIGLCCTGTGFLVYGLSQGKRTGRSGPVIAAAVVCLLATVAMTLVADAAALLVSALLALLACGFIGGRVHFGIARELGDSPAVGRVLGVTGGVVICVQFAIQNLAPGPTASLVCILVAVVLIALLGLRGGGAGVGAAAGAGADAVAGVDVDAAANAAPIALREPQPQATRRIWPDDPAARRRHGLLIVTAAMILTIIFTLNDSIVVAMDASGSVSLFSGIRLCYALGLVAAGFLYDLGPRFSFVFATVALQILAVLVPYFLESSAWCNLNMGLFYFYGGFYVMFITAEFVTFAGHMSRAGLWAGLGRVARCYAAAATVIPVALLYAAFGTIALVIVAVVLSMALLAVCVTDTALLARFRLPASPTAGGGVVEFGADDIERFAGSIGLTDRERDVLVLLVTTEDENQKIASDLGISRRTLQRHVAQVYEKAGVQSRIGLYMSLAAHAGTERAQQDERA